MSLPSEISFVSFLRYSVRGRDELAQKSKKLRDAIKGDGFISRRRPDNTVQNVRAIDHVARLIHRRVSQSRDEFPFLAETLAEDVVLVPAPRSAPLTKGGLWPAKRICDALQGVGLAGQVLPVLERTRAIQKSAFAGAGSRPGPQDHFETMAIRGLSELPMFAAKKVTLVDDFVTRGATFLGAYPHIEKAFSGWKIQCFALVRTQSQGELESIVAPVAGTIFGGYSPQRVP